MNNLKSWEAVIGLETHVQLNTKSKIFTSASTAFGNAPNTHIDPVVCGLPGTLPVLNETVLEYAVKTSLALNLNVAEHCKFDRKQYFILICLKIIKFHNLMSHLLKMVG